MIASQPEIFHRETLPSHTKIYRAEVGRSEPAHSRARAYCGRFRSAGFCVLGPSSTRLTARKLFTSLLFLAMFLCPSVTGYTRTPNVTASTIRYSEVREELLSRPAVKQKVPPGGGLLGVNVFVSLTPIDILDVDDARQVVTASAQLTLSWQDPSLSWDIFGEYPDGVTPNTVSLPIDEIWRPDILIVNGASTEHTTVTSFTGKAGLSFDGNVSMAAALVIQFTCKMDLTVYPFDKQRCPVIVFTSDNVAQITARHSDNQFLPSTRLRELFAVGAEWTYEGQDVEEKEIVVDEYKLVYVEYTWTIARKTTYYVISFIAPIVLTSYMNVAVFMIPVEAGERISYLVTIFVSTAVFVSFCTDIMPQGLDEAPLIVYLVSGIMVQSAVLIIVCSLVLHHFYDQEHAKENDSQTGVGASDVIKYGPTSHNPQDFSAEGFLALTTNQSLRNSRQISANHVHRDKAKEGEQGTRKEPQGSSRYKAKKLDFICFVVSLFINTMLNVIFLAYMMNVAA